MHQRRGKGGMPESAEMACSGAADRKPARRAREYGGLRVIESASGFSWMG